jgi:hypothetical protein
MLVFYTGIGCHPSGKHTEQEFVTIMKNIFIYSPNRTFETFKHWRLPGDFVRFTTRDWVEYAGALIID